MNHDSDIVELTADDIDIVGGGFFWIALPLVLAGGYALGKDRATRDNARDAAAKS